MPRNIIQAIKRNEILIDATMSMNLKNIVLMVEISQTQKAVCCMILFIENAQNRQIHRQELDQWLPGAGFWGD